MRRRRGSCESPFQQDLDSVNSNSDLKGNMAKNVSSPSAIPNRRQPHRFSTRIHFFFGMWALIFVYLSIVAEVNKNQAQAASTSPPEPSSWSLPNNVVPATPAPAGMLASPENSAGKVNGANVNNGKPKYAAFEVPGVNCTPPGIDDFPGDIFTQAQRQQGYVLVHCVVSLYIFWCLAIVCDDFFVPSMECICDGLKLPTDVAGATFMAIATSAPELFTNIIGTFITKGDVGVGTIVGSAVFNILAVAAVCGIGAGMVVPLEWWSVSRDCLCYSLSVTLLLIVLKDERIYWYEALVLVLVYVFYILAMWQNTFLKRGAERLVASVEKKLKTGKTETTYTMKENGMGNGTPIDELDPLPNETRDEVLIENALKNLQNQATESKEQSGLFRPPQGQGCRKACLWCLTWPVNALYMITIPDCREEKWRRWYPLTFFMCVVWIGILSYLVNWMMTVIGHTLTVPDSIMGLTVIAAGTSVPECVSSIIVARQGLGSMALSNSIGSNTFDILICLGLPWLIRASILANNLEVNFIQINSTGLEYSTIMLIMSLAVLYFILALNKFVLDKKVGFIAGILYVCFLVMAILFEMNVFFKVTLPTCLHHEDPIN